MDKKIIDKVIKLFALSENNSNPHEAALAKKKAAELMADHDIKVQDIMMGGEESDIKEDNRDLGKIWLVAYDDLLFHILSKFNGVAFVVSKGNNAVNAHHCFIGRQVDIENNDYMIDIVVNQRQIKWKEYLKIYKAEYGKAPKFTEKTHWMKSFAYGISTKIKELESLKNNIITERGLVPIDRAVVALNKYKENHNVRDGRSRKFKHLKSHGFKAGKSTSLHKGVEGGNGNLMIEK